VTDDFFFKNKNAVGVVMIALSIFMLYSYLIIN